MARTDDCPTNIHTFAQGKHQVFVQMQEEVLNG